MDEEVPTQAENESVEVSDVTESPAVEETTEQSPEVTEPTQDEPQETKPRNNAQSRLREVLGERKQLKSENEELRSLLEQNAQAPIPENLSEDEFRALQANATFAASEVQQLKRELAYKDFANEVDLVEQQFPELNPDSDKYNQELAEALSQAYDEGYILKDKRGQFIGTKKSLKDFTTSMIKAYRVAETKGATATQQALHKQASEAVVTQQTSTSSEPKAFKELSLKEMEAQLGFHKQ